MVLIFRQQEDNALQKEAWPCAAAGNAPGASALPWQQTASGLGENLMNLPLLQVFAHKLLNL
jgi:hypothetical protein